MRTIGLDLRMIGPDFGIGRYSLELTKRILSAGSGHNFVLFVRNPKALSDLGVTAGPNMKVVLADFPHYSWQEQLLFSRLLKRYNLDLVHFFNFNVPITYNRPYVVTVHDMIHHRLPGQKKSHIVHRLAYRAIMRHAVMRAKSIITVSNFSKKEILAFYNLPERKIKVIYEAAQAQPVTDSEITAARQKYGLSKPYMIFVGVMEPKKNVIALARAFDILKDQFNLNIQLALVGKIDLHHPGVLDQARQIKYRKDLIVTGAISDQEKFALLKGAEAFVSASKFEGFGLPGVEAMEMGIPLVVSNIPVFNEIYDNGAIYFEPDEPDDIAQKINFLLTDQKYRQLIANNAYVRGQFFSWDKAAQETIGVYDL